MGWLITPGATRAQVAQEVEQRYRASESVEVLDKAFVNLSQLWLLVRETGKEPVILLYLIKSYGSRKKGTHEAGYKDMSESMGPYYYSCPLRMLEQAPVQNEGWREEVRKYHARKKAAAAFAKQIKPGQYVALRPNLAVPVVELLEVGRTITGRALDGNIYRVKKQQLNPEPAPAMAKMLAELNATRPQVPCDQVRAFIERAKEANQPVA